MDKWTKEQLTCPECGFVAKDKRGLNGHRQFKHGVHPTAQLPLQKQDLLVSESKLEQLLDARFAMVAEQPITKLGKQHTKQLKELQGIAKQLNEVHQLLAEAVSVIGEEQYLLLTGIDGHTHDPKTGAVTFTVESPLAERLKLALEQAKNWESIAQVAETFKPARGTASLERLRPTEHPRGKG